MYGHLWPGKTARRMKATTELRLASHSLLLRSDRHTRDLEYRYIRDFEYRHTKDVRYTFRIETYEGFRSKQKRSWMPPFLQEWSLSEGKFVTFGFHSGFLILSISRQFSSALTYVSEFWEPTEIFNRIIHFILPQSWVNNQN